MADRQITDTTVVIHERALRTLGLETALIMLGVAKDLREGVIEPERYNQATYGGPMGGVVIPPVAYGVMYAPELASIPGVEEMKVQ